MAQPDLLVARVLTIPETRVRREDSWFERPFGNGRYLKLSVSLSSLLPSRAGATISTNPLLPLEKLDGALVLLGLFPGFERAEIPTFSCL
jgi:hypothetical protein